MRFYVSTKKLKQDGKFISFSDLKKRGWSDATIGKFTPEPDDTQANPMYSSAAPMKLYLLARIKRIERRKTWIAWQDTSAVRKKSAAKAVITKTDALMQWLDSLEIEVPKMADKELTSLAIQHYNALWSGTEKRAHASDSPEFLDRISVNYLRHQLTPYEEHLGQIAGKTGAHEARDSLRSAIYEAIGDTYPELRSECWDQQKAREVI
jgi:hypothetical protein